jgi:hypothetical protein
MKNAGVYVRLNGNQPVQKVAGSNGVGTTKSAKADVQKKAGSKGAGTTKSQKAAVSPSGKTGSTKKGR